MSQTAPTANKKRQVEFVEDAQVKKKRRETELAKQSKEEHYSSSSKWELNGKFTNATIKCGSREFRVHRFIVASRCSFFEICFERQWKEREECVVTFGDDDPDALAAVLQYIYKMNFEWIIEEESRLRGAEKEKELTEWLVKIALSADKYDLPLLGEFVRLRLSEEELVHTEKKWTADPRALLSSMKLLYDVGSSDQIDDLREHIATRACHTLAGQIILTERLRQWTSLIRCEGMSRALTICFEKHRC